MMKAAVVFLGSSLAAISSVTITSLSIGLGPSASVPYSCGKVSSAAGSSAAAGGKKDETGSGYKKFVPKFDGLRFIETLVTAHR